MCFLYAIVTVANGGIAENLTVIPGICGELKMKILRQCISCALGLIYICMCVFTHIFGSTHILVHMGNTNNTFNIDAAVR